MPDLRQYAVVTSCYWGFTLTDGALRTLVLFYLYGLGYSPLEVASLFLFYEAFGVVTNLAGGWIAARFGLRSTLFAGLTLQIVACTTLGLLAAQLTIPLVMALQAMSGVAKDLTKMSSKSFIKHVVPAGNESRLMKAVAVLTGSKNALKGVGFFLGGALLSTIGFVAANYAMALLLVVMLLAAVWLLSAPAKTSGAKASWRQILSRDARINWLAAARLFLFGSRDVWFVLALPIFLTATLGWTTAGAGGFLAVWVIGYGVVQALAPAYVGRGGGTQLLAWTAALTVPLLGLVGLFAAGYANSWTLALGLACFGFVFATNSTMHSYLIVSYAEHDRVAMRVGFYYMANAAGRLIGTVLSGFVFQVAGMGSDGLTACLWVSAAMVGASALLCLPLRAAEARYSQRAAR